MPSSTSPPHSNSSAVSPVLGIFFDTEERRDDPLCSAFAGLVVLVGVGKEFIMKMIFALK